ncbi:MAG: M13 family metallopeptidase [bacterium]
MSPIPGRRARRCEVGLPGAGTRGALGTAALALGGALGAILVLGIAVPSEAARKRSLAVDEPPHGLELIGMDRSVAPGDDFFAYANGGWVQDTDIPPDRDGYGVGAALDELVQSRTLDLIQAAAKAKAPAGSEPRKIGDYYTAFMDTVAIEKKGLEPLRPTLDRIAALTDRTGLASFLGGTLRADVDLFNSTVEHTENILGVWVAQDLDEPAHYAVFLVQGGLVMPDRAYYLEDSGALPAIRAQYLDHVTRVLSLAGVPDAAARAERIVGLEHAIAEVHESLEESDSVEKGNNHWARADFDARAPGIDWTSFFAAAGLAAVPRFVVWQPAAVTGISALVAAQPLEDWQDYLTFHAIEKAAPFLPAAYADERFAFHDHVVRGIPQQRERTKRAVEATNDALGDAVGKLYVKRWFPPSEKARAQAMVRGLVAAFGRRIDNLEWMSKETKARAKAKLATLEVGVGYPDRWRDYSGLRIDPADAFGNAERAQIFTYRTSLAKLGKPVDRSEWVMTPQTVDAVNLPAMNAMNFPAGILQPPFFDPKRPAPMDYGDMGASIGHEISHSFDDQGALFDANGRLSNWWTDADLAHFRAATAKLVEQYSAYRPFPDARVDGALTLSENIADLGGVAVAYDAYRVLFAGKSPRTVQGFTGDQQFFLAYAQGWRSKRREASARARLVTESHSPSEYRADTVRNLDAWYAAFDVQPGQALYLAPTERVRIW